MDPKQVLLEQIQEIFKVDAAQLDLELPLAETAGWNSLRFVRLIGKLENRLGVQFHAHEFATLRSWSHFLQLLQEKGARAK